MRVASPILLAESAGRGRPSAEPGIVDSDSLSDFHTLELEASHDALAGVQVLLALETTLSLHGNLHSQ